MIRCSYCKGIALDPLTKDLVPEATFSVECWDPADGRGIEARPLCGACTNWVLGRFGCAFLDGYEGHHHRALAL